MDKFKEFYELSTTYIECDCHTHLLQLAFDNKEDNYGSTRGSDLRFLYISFYNWGHSGSKYSWKDKMKHIWCIIKYGHPWVDEIVLRKSERLKLTEYLNSLNSLNNKKNEYNI